MELIGLLLAAPLTLLTSLAYTALANALFRRWPTAGRVALPISCGVVALATIEILLFISIGAKSAFLYLHHAFTVLHFSVIFLTPPAIANIVLHFAAKRGAKESLRFIVGAGCCWFVCMAMLLGNIMVDEAIMGVKAGRPFYMTKAGPNTTVA
jgi:hypothetical protein